LPTGAPSKRNSDSDDHWQLRHYEPSDGCRQRPRARHGGLAPNSVLDQGHQGAGLQHYAETIRTKLAFKQPFERRRCLVPATGWYEWQDLGKGKKKRPIHMCAKSKPFAFAGVWDVWKGDGGPGVTSFTIVITDPTPSIAQYHDRMPVLFEESQFDEWMRGTPDHAAALMVPYAGAIKAWEVSADVGSPRNNRPGLLDRVGLV